MTQDVAKVAEDEWTAEKERAAIVAWLRRPDNANALFCAATFGEYQFAEALHFLGKAIERGEHTETGS